MYTVEIIETSTDRVVESFECLDRHDAERVERGVNINLNHSEYHTNRYEQPQLEGLA